MAQLDDTLDAMLTTARVACPHGGNPILFPPWRTQPADEGVPKQTRDQTRHAGHHDTGRHVGKILPIRDARRVSVVARMGAPVHIRPEPFPMPLDGIMSTAARVWLGLPGQQSRAAVPIPCAALRPSKSGWVWAASCAREAGPVSRETTFWHRRQDHEQIAEMTGGKILKPPASNGRYRGMRMPLPLTFATSFEWRACGDPEWIEKLLSVISHIGPDKGQGYGRVVEWTVADHGPVDGELDTGRDARFDWAVWGEDGTIARPVPVKHAGLLGLLGATPQQTVRCAYRPPYYHDHGDNAAAGECFGPGTTR